MKINPNNIIALDPKLQSDAGSKNAGKADVEKGSKASVVNISSRAEELAQIRARLEEIPEVRMDKVQAVKEEIQAGTYQRDSEATALRLLSDSLMFSLFSES